MNYEQVGNNVFMNTYSRFPITFESGKGCYLYDTNQKEYLDFVSGIAVNALGYQNESYNQALKDQIDKLMHVSNLYYNVPAVELGKMMTDLSGFSKVFYCNSGAEAVEASLKLARMYGAKYKANKPSKIIAMQNSFHGRTFGAVTATGQLKYQKDLGELVPNIVHVPFNDFEALKKEADDTTCGIILEPVQGEGGIRPADPEYLKNVRTLCDEKDIVLIYDEVQCGIGRLGTLFAYETYDVIPDVVVMAKGLGAGFPIGSILANDKVQKAFEPGNHASTFGGNALACAAAKNVLEQLTQNKILDNVKKQGDFLKNELLKLQEKHDLIKDVRGKGLMMGIELAIPCKEVIAACIEKGLLLVGAGEKIIRFVPPLIVTEKEIGQCLQILDNVLDTIK